MEIFQQNSKFNHKGRGGRSVDRPVRCHLLSPYMIHNIKFGMLYLLSACIFLSAIFNYCLILEAKGLPLEQVHLLFDSCI